jgi:hypothetical protein
MAKRAPSPRITEPIAEDAVRHLARAMQQCGRDDLLDTLRYEVTRNHIYVTDGQGGPLCRLRYTGDPDYWALNMFKWSSERYDTRNDFGFGGGTLPECLDALLHGYRL